MLRDRHDTNIRDELATPDGTAAFTVKAIVPFSFPRGLELRKIL